MYKFISKKLFQFCCLTLCVLSSGVFAATWGPSERITSIEVGANFVYIASPSYTACGSATGQTLLTMDVASAKEIYAAALEAYTNNKPVKLYTDGCVSGYSKVLRIMF